MSNLKIGDKVVCIKNITITDDRKWIKNTIYTITKKSNVYDEFYIACFANIGAWFNEYEFLYAEHFITLAEWRDKQINEILKDELINLY